MCLVSMILILGRMVCFPVSLLACNTLNILETIMPEERYHWERIDLDVMFHENSRS